MGGNRASNTLEDWQDKPIFPLVTFDSAHAAQGEQERLTWLELVERLRVCKRTPESAAEYEVMSKQERGRVKDVGAFLGAVTRGAKRDLKSIQQRSLITVDADNCEPGDIERAVALLEGRGLAYVLYTTHSHSPEAPRFRLVLPICPTVSPSDYALVARAVAHWLSLGLSAGAIDDSCIRATQLMYYPSASRDAEFISRANSSGRYVDPSEWLDEPKGAFAPKANRPEGGGALTPMMPENNPREKRGAIGAFCRAYTIAEAIDTFLSDVYERAGKGRYTYKGGSSWGGLHLLDECYAFSHHSTDPAGGTARNAFDLVRIHKFGHLDSDSSQRIEKRPSFVAMCSFVAEDPRGRKAMLEDTVKDLIDDLEDETPGEGEDETWRNRLTLTAKSGRVEPTRPNIQLILLNDARFRGKIRYNEFSQKIERWGILGNVSQPQAVEGAQWSDSDEADVRCELELGYGITNRQAIEDVLIRVAKMNAYHPVKNMIESTLWDGVPRVELLYIDYLGAKDTELMRAFARKALIAGVSRIYKPGVKFDYITVFTGAEGAGKSTLIRKLGYPWYSDSVQTMEGRDAMEQIAGAWLIEVAELGAFRKSELAAIKAFISKTSDEYRPAYGRNTVTRPRRCIFFATTNEHSFVRNEGGNRRFWVVPIMQQPQRCKPWELTLETVQQLWAEAKYYYDQGEELDLPLELKGQAEGLRVAHEEEDPLKMSLVNYLLTPVPCDWYSSSPWS